MVRKAHEHDYLLRLAVFDVLCQRFCRPGTQREGSCGRVHYCRFFVPHLAYPACLSSVSVLGAVLLCFVFAPRLIVLRLLAEFLASATYLVEI